METMTIERINELQKDYGLDKAQSLLNSGQIWGFEGSVGRAASNLLDAGVLVLPEERTRDYHGNTIPARGDLKDGTKGTLGLAQEFWSSIEDGDDQNIEFVEQYRGFMDFGFSGTE